MYIRVGNQTVTAAQLNALTPADVQKINTDAARAENKRQDNLAESMGFKKTPHTLNLVPDVRPGSDIVKALIEDLNAKNEAEAKLNASIEEVKKSAGKKRGRPAGSKTKKAEVIVAQDQTQL